MAGSPAPIHLRQPTGLRDLAMLLEIIGDAKGYRKMLTEIVEAHTAAEVIVNEANGLVPKFAALETRGVEVAELEATVGDRVRAVKEREGAAKKILDREAKLSRRERENDAERLRLEGVAETLDTRARAMASAATAALVD